MRASDPVEASFFPTRLIEIANVGDHVRGVQPPDSMGKILVLAAACPALHRSQHGMWGEGNLVCGRQLEPPPLKWSTLRYVFGQDGGPRCRARDTRPRRSSPSCAR